MTWFDRFLIIWWLLGAVIIAAQTGKPRKPIEPATVGAYILIAAALIFGLLRSRGVL